MLKQDLGQAVEKANLHYRYARNWVANCDLQELVKREQTSIASKGYISDSSVCDSIRRNPNAEQYIAEGFVSPPERQNQLQKVTFWDAFIAQKGRGALLVFGLNK